jgi:hypothetical protein
MERGTDWEYEAVRRQWATMERRRRATTRLLSGVTLCLAAVVLFMLALAGEACVGDAGIPPTCTAVVPDRLTVVLLGGSLLALVSGLRVCWSAVRE